MFVRKKSNKSGTVSVQVVQKTKTRKQRVVKSFGSARPDDMVAMEKLMQAASSFRNIVICRLFNPGSKLKSVDYMERYLHVTYSVDQVYRFLDNLCYRKEDEKEKEEASGENEDGKECDAPRPQTEAKAKPDDFKTRVENIAYSYKKRWSAITYLSASTT